jgi:mRNA-degrading endonuclease toxin of MazEF toxin-antitoxin module
VSTSTQIRQGQIYWLDDCEPLEGDTEKDRPVIVLSSPAMLRASKTDPVLVVACSTHPRKRDVPRFELPTRHEDSETGLPKKCWAIARWYLPINRFRLTTVTGKCPEPLFNESLIAVLAQMDADQRAGQE